VNRLRDLAAALRRLVWAADLQALPRLRAWPLRFLRIAHAVLRDLAEGQLTLRAMSLVYTTLLSLVPLIAVSFSVLKGLGVHYQLEPLLLNLLEPLGEKGVEVTERLIGFVENIRTGVLGTLGLVFLLFTVVSLIQKIEGAFNATWRVASHRSLGQRFSNYLSVILVGPLLVISALGITATVTHLEGVGELVTLLGPVLQLFSRVLPYLLVIAAFALVYVLVPNTRVRPASALLGAVVAGLLWESVGWAFTSFVAGSANYTAIYSAFATMILFMIWLFLSWLILLIGASFAFYHQHPEYLVAGLAQLRLSPRQRERCALGLLLRLGTRFARGAPAPTAAALAAELRLPEPLVEELLGTLADGGFVTATASEPPGFVPARDPDGIGLLAVLECVRRAGEVLPDRPRHGVDLEPVDTLLAGLHDAAAARLDGTTLADLVAAAAGGAAAPAATGPVLHSNPGRDA